MNFPLSIVLPKEVSDVAQGPVERYLSEEEQADIKKFSQHIKNTLTFENCKPWSKNAVAFEICDFGIYAESDGRKFFCMSVTRILMEQKLKSLTEESASESTMFRLCTTFCFLITTL